MKFSLSMADALLKDTYGPQNKCMNCDVAFYSPQNLKKHMKFAHPLTTITEASYKEAPMNGTLTMNEGQLSLAKKQRDKLRQSIRNDIAKFANKYGVKEFEAAHAIIDTVLDTIDTNAKNYGGAVMPNGLAQTLLPSTQALIGNAPQESYVDPSDYVTWDAPSNQYMKASSVLFGAPIPKLKKKAAPASKKPGPFAGTLKPDTAVEVTDTAETIIGEVYKQFAEAKKAAKGYNDLSEQSQGSWTYLLGHTYISTWDKTKLEKYPNLKAGYNYVVIYMKKSAPYMTANMLNTFNVAPPVGMKWRKLKNKQIYKLMKDPKQSYYWNKKEQEAKALKADVLKNAGITPVSVPADVVPESSATVLTVDNNGYTYNLIPGIQYTPYLKAKIAAPEGYVWAPSALTNTYSLITIEEYNKTVF